MKTIKFNSEIRPKTNPHDFDAHIYFKENEIDFVSKLKIKLEKEFNSSLVFVGNIIPYAIGPHPMGMLEVNFGTSDFQKVVFFLMKEREGLSILVHSISHDDYRDHTEGAIWLGSVVKLNLDLFKKNNK